MRRTFVAAAFAAALTACATTGTTTTITIADVQNAAVAACQFLPDATTIANILTASPVAATAESVAAIICAAVGNQPAAAVRHRATAPFIIINGQTIPITGHFVTQQGRRAR
jgi:hypothetical protein